MLELNLRAALTENGGTLDEKQEKFVEGLEVAIRKAMEGNNTSIEQTIKDNLKAEGMPLSDETSEQLRTLGSRLDTMEKGEKGGLTDIQKRMLKARVAENHEAIVEAVRNQNSVEFGRIVFGQTRVAAPHTNANTMTLGVGVNMPLVENIDTSAIIAMPRYPDNFIFDIISSRQVAKVVNTRFINEFDETDGEVTIVAECGEKPLIQYTFVKNAISRKKIAGRIEWCEEFEIDNEALFSAIVKMLENDVLRKWNDETIDSIIANATAYTSGAYANSIQSPNTGDAAVVLAAIINAQDYNADTIILNPTDLTLLLLSKTTDGVYIEHPIFNNGNSGFNVISSNSIDAGDILVFDSSTYSEEHTALDTRTGQYNEQFIHNEWTYLAEMYTILMTAAIEKVATIYGTIATIEADIEAPAA